MINLVAEVQGLVSRVNAAAVDEHDARSTLLALSNMLQGEFMKAQAVSNEALAHLVLAKRAADTGVSIEDQKNAVGIARKKRSEDVTAAEVLDVVILSEQGPAIDAEPVDPKVDPKG